MRLPPEHGDTRALPGRRPLRRAQLPPRGAVRGGRHLEQHRIVREILGLFATDMFAADGRLEFIEGSATWFLQQMLQQDAIKEMLRGEVTARSIGKQLGALMSSASFPLAYKRNSHQRVWSISRTDFEQYTKTGTQKGGQDELCPF